MDSEKVKEIKKALEYCSNHSVSDCSNVCPYDKYTRCRTELTKDSLTLINELESENEMLLGVIDIDNEREYRKKFNDEWRKEYQKELDKQGNGHIAGYPDFDLVYKLYFEQKDRIDELESENERLRLERDVLIGKKIVEKQKHDKAIIMKIDIQKQLKNRIAELEKENKSKTDTITDLLKKQEFYEKDKLKQFAERLKKRTILYSGINVKYEAITADIIDELLKEYEE